MLIFNNQSALQTFISLNKLVNTYKSKMSLDVLDARKIIAVQVSNQVRDHQQQTTYIITM